MLKKFNAILNKLSMPLNVINIIVGLLIGIAHVYIPLTSILGLVLGIIMALSGSAVMGISYYFTAKNTNENADKSGAKKAEPEEREHTLKSKIFLGIAIPMILLNAAGSFFGMYTGTILLAGALGTPIAPAVIIGISIVLATILAVGMLINSWLQVNHIADGFKQVIPKVTGTAQAHDKEKADITLDHTTKLHKQPIRLVIPPQQPKSIPEKISGIIGSFFNKPVEKQEQLPITNRPRRMSSPPAFR